MESLTNQDIFYPKEAKFKNSMFLVLNESLRLQCFPKLSTVSAMLHMIETLDQSHLYDASHIDVSDGKRYGLPREFDVHGRTFLAFIYSMIHEYTKRGSRKLVPFVDDIQSFLDIFYMGHLHLNESQLQSPQIVDSEHQATTQSNLNKLFDLLCFSDSKNLEEAEIQLQIIKWIQDFVKQFLSVLQKSSQENNSLQSLYKDAHFILSSISILSQTAAKFIKNKKIDFNMTQKKTFNFELRDNVDRVEEKKQGTHSNNSTIIPKPKSVGTKIGNERYQREIILPEDDFEIMEMQLRNDDLRKFFISELGYHFYEDQHEEKAIIPLNGHDLTLEKLSLLGRGQSKIQLDDKTWKKLRATRDVVERLAKEPNEKPYYGINSGVGIFSNKKLTGQELKEFQVNLIRSHATGIGENLDLDPARRILVLRINTLAKGLSGISINTMERLIEFYNSGIVPQIPSCGSVGASGDLVPLSHIGLNLIGEGEIWNPTTASYENAVSVLREYDLKIAQLAEKDALSLINGNQFICGVGSVALEKSINIIKSIAPISALTFLSMKGSPLSFDLTLQRMRMHPGQAAIAAMMRELLPAGKTVTHSAEIQDPYSLKCIPQVHGPTLEAVVLTKDCLEIEMNSGSDNPMIFTEAPYLVSGGNFHGEYPAKQLDVLGLYVHEIGSLSSQRIKRLTNPTKNLGLPAFLVSQGGLCSGMMTWENVAASLVSENKVLVYPASADSAETCADKEDHVSMGSFSAKKAIMIADNVLQILAVELLGATQALQHRYQLEKDFDIYHPGLKNIFEMSKKISPILEKDRYTQPEYQELLEFISSGDLYDAVLEEMSNDWVNYDYANNVYDNPEIRKRILQ
eukprot:403360518